MKTSIVIILRRRGSPTSVCLVCVIPAASKRNFCFLGGGSVGKSHWEGAEFYEHNGKKAIVFLQYACLNIS